ncbi:MAG: glycosyltransferase family 9 protein [bacterium]
MKRALIVRTSAFGDVLHGLPVAAAIKKRYPWARLSWLVDEKYRHLLEASPCVDEVIAARFRLGPRSHAGRNPTASWAGILRLLRRGAFDVVIDLQGLVRSGLLSFWTRAPVRIGFPLDLVREGLNVAFSNLRPRGFVARSHVVDRNLSLLHPLGIRTRERDFPLRIPADWLDPILPLLEEAGAARHRRLRAALHPAAGWATKQWSLERYAEIAERLERHWDADVWILWGPGERGLAEQVKELARASVRILPDLDIKGLAAFLGRCDMFLGGDSGPLHLASALGLPVLGLYGPSDPVRNGPPGKGARVLASPSPCAPCFRRTCPDRACMRAITVAQVWEGLEQVAQEHGLSRGLYSRLGKGLKTSAVMSAEKRSVEDHGT